LRMIADRSSFPNLQISKSLILLSMNADGTEQERLDGLLMSLKSVDIPPHDGFGFAGLQEMLARRIDELIASNFSMLSALLYRVDVDEAKIKAALQNAGEEETTGHVMAHLIIARQLEKLKWRKKQKA